jgi:GNAT superfamily N-acetyltransferase
MTGILPIIYQEGGIELLDTIAPLWRKLTIHHAGISTHFHDHFLGLRWDERKDGLVERSRNGGVHNVLAKIAAEDRYVGYCIGAIDKQKNADIESLFVEDDFRGGGIGTEMVRRMIVWMDGNGAVCKTVSVAVGNEKAYRFYEQFGFLPRLTVLQQEEKKM